MVCPGYDGIPDVDGPASEAKGSAAAATPVVGAGPAARRVPVHHEHTASAPGGGASRGEASEARTNHDHVVGVIHALSTPDPPGL